MKLVAYDGQSFPWVVGAASQDMFDPNYIVYRLHRPPGRFWADQLRKPDIFFGDVDSARVEELPTPVRLLEAWPEAERGRDLTRRSQSALHAWFLIAEDAQGRLHTNEISMLAHQVSLVEHVLRDPDLQNVLIADEVGLGKTIEAGRIVQELLAQNADLRVLYLAPARLVSNVVSELSRLQLRFRPWSTVADGRASLQDPLVVASIHRAAHPAHFDEVVASAPWDVIVVDECHHLSDWGAGGGKPTKRYRLLEMLKERMPSAGRLILMSGTPHQGHADRFRNVLRLLVRKGESEEAVRGRVIYRMKEDVRDWEGGRLFPLRDVRAPRVLELSEAHRQWLKDIHALFSQEQGYGDNDARTRAVGWRAGQALQWATSSVEAGLGYLVRQGVRAGWDLDEPALADALACLRPYRGGAPDEPLPSLLSRVQRQVEAAGRRGGGEDEAEQDDVEDLSAEPVSQWRPDAAALAAALRHGVELLRSDPDGKWQVLWSDVLQAAVVEGEKVVLFAQPIETVTSLSRFLVEQTGIEPALLIGSQNERERELQVKRFHQPDGPLFLIASKAGTEGFNLQIARRLVHLDVPWNPMELEQRVGRVHRFMSRKTVLVDTLVVKGSREEDTYQTARDKLQLITQDLEADPSRRELLFSRVMALVPPETLQSVMASHALGPLSTQDRRRVHALVAEGFERWKTFHDQYAESATPLTPPEPGQARWDDLIAFARRRLGAEPVAGYTALGFRWDRDEVVDACRPAEVLRIGDDEYACGDYGGLPVTNAGNRKAPTLGLNTAVVAQALRSAAFPAKSVGVGAVRLRVDVPALVAELTPCTVVVWCRQSLRSERGSYREASTRLRTFCVTGEGELIALDDKQQASMIRAVVDAEPLRDSGPDTLRVSAEQQRAMALQLRQATEDERAERVVHVPYPVAAFRVTS